jgi:4-hydroxymandelate oxidase
VSPAHDSDPAAEQLLSLRDYEHAAARVLDPAALAYFAGGAGDELSLHQNVAAWQRLALRPRVLAGVERRDPGVTLLGTRRPHPLIVAPMAFQALAHPDGERATARGAHGTGTVVSLATLGSTSIPELAQAVPEATRWFQVYVFKDRGVTRELIAQAGEHGYEALVVTVDLPVVGRRERELRTPSSAHADAIPGGRAAGAEGALTPMQFAALVDPALRWSDIERLVADQPLPVIVKGVLRSEDARLAADHGARGVVVSNHGARQLDTTLTGAEALAPIVDTAGDRLDVIVDGGIRRGTDVLKALALGARAVMVGRPLLWGLALDGASGVQRVLEILLTELDVALALTGAPDPAQLDRSFVSPAAWVTEPR